MPKPPISVVDEPRPVPNSKRPPETWSIIATRSATRAGWLTGGVTLMIPLPTCICSVRASTHGISTSLAEMCEYSSRKWCSVNQAYFQLCWSPTSHSSHLAHEAVVLGVGVGGPHVPVDEAALEEAEFHAL